MRRPGLLARFHNHGGKVLAELVGVNLKPAEFGFLEHNGESSHFGARAQPNVAAFSSRDARAELLALPRPGLAICAFGYYHKICAVELLRVIELVLESLLHAERGGALLQNAEQHAARDAGESVALGADDVPLEVHVDVVPMVELIDDACMRGRVRFQEVAHGLVRKHDAPAEGVVRAIALENLDRRGGQGLLEQDRGIQASGAAAHADNSLHTSLYHV